MTILDQSWKKSYTLVEFAYGDPRRYSRYTDSNSDLSTIKGFFLSEPRMKVNLAPNTAGVKENPLKVELPLRPGDTFIDEVSDGRLFPRVTVTVMELLRGEPPEPDQILTHFSSRMSITMRNPSGRQELIRFLSQHPKSRLEQPITISCNPQCSWVFGHLNTCGFDLSTIQQTGTLTITGANEVNVTGITVPNPGQSYDNYFLKGWIGYDGLRLTIQNWDRNSPGDFKLLRKPPRNWEGATVTVTPGCLLTVTACRFWGNEARFMGLGIGMPIYNPLLEFTEVGR